MGVKTLVAKFCAIPTPFRDHHFGVNQLTHGLSFLQSARTGRECYKPGLCKEQRPRQLRNNVAQNGHKMVPIINESIILKLPKKGGTESDTSSTSGPHVVQEGPEGFSIDAAFCLFYIGLNLYMVLTVAGGRLCPLPLALAAAANAPLRLAATWNARIACPLQSR